MTTRQYLGHVRAALTCNYPCDLTCNYTTALARLLWHDCVGTTALARLRWHDCVGTTALARLFCFAAHFPTHSQNCMSNRHRTVKSKSRKRHKCSTYDFGTSRLVLLLASPSKHVDKLSVGSRRLSLHRFLVQLFLYAFYCSDPRTPERTQNER
jgi:hypothetical protein